MEKPFEAKAGIMELLWRTREWQGGGLEMKEVNAGGRAFRREILDVAGEKGRGRGVVPSVISRG